MITAIIVLTRIAMITPMIDDFDSVSVDGDCDYNDDVVYDDDIGHAIASMIGMTTTMTMNTMPMAAMRMIVFTTTTF